MKTKLLYNRLKNRIKSVIRINASIEVLIFNTRIINYLADKKGTVYYIYLL